MFRSSSREEVIWQETDLAADRRMSAARGKAYLREEAASEPDRSVQQADIPAGQAAEAWEAAPDELEAPAEEGSR